MSKNFYQTVNLKKKSEILSRQNILSAQKQNRINHASELDRIYDNKNGENEDKKINRAPETRNNESFYKRMLILVIFIILIFTAYFLFFHKNNDIAYLDNSNWYSVKLVNEEVFYGQIDDISSDPVFIKNVYYNYDKDKNENSNETSSLRLVKRGKETYGPDGTMNIVRAQILYMESLKEDSKVLNAILDYEK